MFLPILRFFLTNDSLSNMCTRPRTTSDTTVYGEMGLVKLLGGAMDHSVTTAFIVLHFQTKRSDLTVL